MWIVSFADLVTLMMSFFVVLYALKQGGEKQQLETAVAIRKEFDPNYTADGDTPFDVEYRRQSGKPGPPHKDNGGYAPRPTNGADGLGQAVTAIRPGTQIVSGTKINFEQNGTVLDEESRKAIGQIAKSMRGLNNILYIKGHVSLDELKPTSKDDPEGMVLSYQRAVAVVDELAKDGLDRKVLRPMACGPYEPVRTGVYDPASLQQNRRVEVYSTDLTASELAPIPTVQATGRTVDTQPAPLKKQVASAEKANDK